MIKLKFLSDKVLRKNFSYLFILQIANYIIPLFLFPYLGTVLGTENFGKIMFAQAFVAYFILFTDFGFNVSSTKQIADALGNKIKISQTFWNTMLAKMLLLSISLLFFLLIVILFARFRQDSLIFFISFINVISAVLFPIWLFQGLEKMGFIAIINTVPRILMCLFTFYLVKSTSDYNIALLIQVLATLISAILSLFLVFYLKLIFFIKPDFKMAKKQISDGWHIFATSLSSNLYTTTNTLILGLIAGNAAVGIYSAADKIIRALISLLSSITQVIFPRVNVYYNTSKEKCLDFIKQILIITSIICVVIGFFIFYFSDNIISLMFKTREFNKSAEVLRFSVLLPLFSVINGIIAINVLITFGLKKILLSIVMIGCFISLILIVPLVILFGEIGAVICATFTEIIIFILLIRTLKKKQLLHET